MAYILGNTKFVNPYQFASLPENVKRSKYNEGKLTGYLSVSLRTLSYLFIPNTTNEYYHYPELKGYGHKSMDFYSYEDLSNKTDNNRKYKPVIPGSELRGCIRSIHEIQNDSCFSNTDLDMQFSKRAGAQIGFSPYIMFFDDNGNMTLYKAKTYTIGLPDKRSDAENYHRFIHSNFLRNFDALKNNMFGRLNTVTGLFETYDVTKKDDVRPGTCFCRVGEYFDVPSRDSDYHGQFNHRSVSFYEIDENTRPISLNAKQKEMLLKCLNDYADPKINKADSELETRIKDFEKAYDEKDADKLQKLMDEGHTGYVDVRKRIEAKLPVLVYMNENKSISTANIGKYILPDCLGDLLKRDTKQCSSIDDSCLTCQIFGFINKNNNNSHSGRVRFTDAITNMDANSCYEKWVTLKPLLTPHPNNTIFYGYNEEQLDDCRNWEWIENQGTILRGRKMYLHGTNSHYSCQDKTDLNNTIHPVKKNITFQFKIYYENLTEEQLKSLIKSVNLYNSNNNETYAHKLGKAKPFGFGSVLMKVDEVVSRKITKQDRGIQYIEEKLDIQTDYSSDNGIADKELRVLCNTYYLNNYPEVTYPHTDRLDEEGFEWFVNNQASGRNNQCFQYPVYIVDSVENKDEEEILKELPLMTNRRIR